MNNSVEFSKKIRVEVLKMIHNSGSSHVGSSLSCVDILSVLYFDFLNINKDIVNDPLRDYFILSKGHAAAAIYSTLALKGLIPLDYLQEYCCDSAKLPGHITQIKNSGVEVSSGALGHGLPIGLGIAIGNKNSKLNNKTVVLLSDGECQEGSNWEAFLMAPRFKLKNLFVIVDYNKLQGYDRTDDLSSFSNMEKQMELMGWNSITIEGHNHSDIKRALTSESDKPTFILANTVKGKGVSFMEDKLEWHYKTTTPEQLNSAIEEILKK